MTSEEIDYIRHRMAKAKDTVEEAKLLFESDHMRGAVNRLYYACFYMVSALLLTEGLHSSKHSGIRSLFVYHWIKTRRLPEEIGDFYQRLFDRRQKGDYSDLIEFNSDDVAKWFEEALAFITTISERVEEQLRAKQGEG